MDNDRSAWRHHDVIQTPSGDLFVAEWDRYSRACVWTQLLPTGHTVTDLPDTRAVLLSRVVDGKPLAVTDLGAGDLYAVRTLHAVDDPPEWCKYEDGVPGGDAA